MQDQFKQIISGKIKEIKVKGSRFIGEVGLVRSVEDVESFLMKVKKREYNATHHCWAYRLGLDENTFRVNDDGEPSGTAGQPILRQIDGVGVTNAMIVVTRYYGGTKLGTGGLIRAYGDAAKYVLEECQFEEVTIRDNVRVIFDYDDTSLAMHTIHNYDINIKHSEYHDRTELTLAVRKSELQAFQQAFVEKLRGRGIVDYPI